MRVSTDKTHCEHNEPDNPSIADMRADIDRRGFVPLPELMHRSKICSHSITSSARASSDGGTVRPSALAVLRLIDQLVLGRRLHRQVGRLLALEDAIDVAGRAPVLVDSDQAHRRSGRRR